MTASHPQRDVSEVVTDLAEQAIALLDCNDELSQAIEDNYRAAEMFRLRYEAGESADPSELLMAYGALRALLRQAQNRVEAQAQSLGRLGVVPLARPVPVDPIAAR